MGIGAETPIGPPGLHYRPCPVCGESHHEWMQMRVVRVAEVWCTNCNAVISSSRLAEKQEKPKKPKKRKKKRKKS